MTFLACDRDQQLLLPPDLREWLPGDHLAWFLIDVVGGLDLGEFFGEGLVEGPGRPAYDPLVMVMLLLYAYAVGERSSRVIERRCREDVAFRVITANRAPDHSTISRFRKEHAGALAGLFRQALALCARAGMVKVGRIAVDGTRLAGNAGIGANRSYKAIREEVERMLAEAEEADEREDGLFGQARGDELPSELADPRSRRARLERAKAELEAEEQQRQAEYQAKLAARDERRSRAKNPGGRPPTPPSPGELERSKRNITDPESRIMSRRGAHVQGYNAQAAVAEGGIILAAEVTNSSTDSNQLLPTVTAARENLDAIGHQERIKCALADGGYWNSEQIAALRKQNTTVVIPTRDPHNDHKRVKAPLKGPEADRANKILNTAAGRRLYRRRAAIVEPYFAHTRHHRRFDRFSRRGQEAADHEWKLAAAVNNLLKLFRYHPQTA